MLILSEAISRSRSSSSSGAVVVVVWGWGTGEVEEGNQVEEWGKGGASCWGLRASWRIFLKPM